MGNWHEVAANVILTHL